MKRIKIKPLKAIGDLIIYVYGLVLTLPFFFAIVTAFKTEQERVLNPIGLPEKFSLNNFVTAWIEGNLLVASKNSIVIAVGTTALLLANVVLVSSINTFFTL